MHSRMTAEDDLCLSETFARQGRNSLHLRKMEAAGRLRVKELGYLLIMKNHDVPVADAVFLQARLDTRNKGYPPTISDKLLPWSVPALRHVGCAPKPIWTPAPEMYIREEEFAIIYREAYCSNCGELARSKRGCIVEIAKYPLAAR